MQFGHNQKLKTNCFAYDMEENKCNALSELICGHENCRFYKDKVEVNTKEIEKAIKHYGCTTKQTD